MFNRCSPGRHFLNKLQANLSLSNTPHSIQQEELPLLNCIICVDRKMPLEFGNGFCAPCEPSARVWHKGNDPRRPIAIIVVDVDLQ